MNDQSAEAPNIFLGQGVRGPDLASSSPSAPMTDIGVDEKIHILQGQLQELNDRLDLMERDLHRHRRLLVQLSNRVRDQTLRQADHDQHLRNFIIAMNRASEAFIRFTDHTHGF